MTRAGRTNRSGWPRRLGAALLAGSVCFAWPSAAQVAARHPEIRPIEPGRDDPALARIETVRRRLPEKNRRRNNFAWAVAKIEGLDKVEYYAHSGIQSLDDFSKELAKQLEDISLRPEKGRYKALCVNQNDVVDGNDCWVRVVDTEYKILEDMAARMPDPSVKGRIKLYTDLPPCASCWNAMKQFMAEYTNVNMSVLYRSK